MAKEPPWTSNFEKHEHDPCEDSEAFDNVQQPTA